MTKYDQECIKQLQQINKLINEINNNLKGLKNE